MLGLKLPLHLLEKKESGLMGKVYITETCCSFGKKKDVYEEIFSEHLAMI